jgi:hypothetical protein
VAIEMQGYGLGQQATNFSGSVVINIDPMDVTETPRAWAADDFVMIVLAHDGSFPSVSGWTAGTTTIPGGTAYSVKPYYREVDAALIGTTSPQTFEFTASSDRFKWVAYAVRGATSLDLVRTPTWGATVNPPTTDGRRSWQRRLDSSGATDAMTIDPTVPTNEASTATYRAELYVVVGDAQVGVTSTMDVNDLANFSVHGPSGQESTPAAGTESIFGSMGLVNDGTTETTESPDLVWTVTGGDNADDLDALFFRTVFEFTSSEPVSPDVSNQYERLQAKARALPFYLDSGLLRRL